jgi:hypothetical protein
MLKFSKSSSLSLTLDCTKHASIDLPIWRILDERTVSRLQHFNITLSDYDPDAALTLQNAPAAKLLRTLTISCTRVVLVLPSTLFASSLPQLNSLTLSGCIVPWDATALFQRLVHLSIHLAPDANRISGGNIDDHSAAFRDAMTALRSMGPTLRSLTLRNFIPALPSQTTCDISKLTVNLPSLKDMVLEGASLRCTTFMSHLSYPPDTNISLFLDCKSPATLLETVHDLGFPSLRPTTLEIDFDAAEHVELALRLHLPQAPGTSRAHTRTLYINFTATGYRWTSLNQYFDAVHALHLDDVRTLVHRASFVRTWPARMWRTLLDDARTPRLRSVLAFGVPATIALLDALAPEDDAPAIAARLRRLDVAPLVPGDAHLARRQEVLVLADFLEMRAQAGCEMLCVTTAGVDGREV